MNKLCVTWLSYRTSYRQETRIARREGSKADGMNLKKMNLGFLSGVQTNTPSSEIEAVVVFFSGNFELFHKEKHNCFECFTLKEAAGLVANPYF